MPVSLDIRPRLDVGVADAVVAAAKAKFGHAADDISQSWSKRFTGMFDSLDGTRARAELGSVQSEYARTAKAAEDARRMMVRSADDAAVSIGRLHDALSRYGGSSTQVIAASSKVEQAWARSQDAAAAHTEAVNAATLAHNNFQDKTAETASAVSAAGRIFNATGVASIAALGTAMYETSRQAANFQDSQQKLSSAADVSATDAKTLADGVLQLAGHSKYSAQEMLNASYGLAKMGDQYRDGANAVSMMRVATQLAAVEGAPLDNVIRALTISMNDYNIPVTQAADIASKLKVAVGDSGTTMDEFSGSLHSVEPVASAFGIAIEDVYTAVARYTKTGTSADQATENIRNSINSLKDVQSPAAQEMRKFGIDADDVALKLKGVDQGGRGYLGTIQYLTDTVLQKFSGQSQIATGDIIHNAAALDNAKRAVTEFQGPLHDMAQGVLDGTMTVGDFRKVIKDLPADQAGLASGFLNDVTHIDEFSKQFKNGRQTIEDVSEALKRITGTVAGQSVAEALFGDPEKAKATLDELDKLQKTTADSAGNVAGASGAMSTLNARMDQARNAFGAAAIEIGTSFVPVLSETADGVKTVADFMAGHPRLAHDATLAMGGLAGSYAVWKIASSDAVRAVLNGFGRVVDGIGVMKTAAAEANTILADAGPSAASGARGVAAASTAEVEAEQRVTAAAAEADAALAGGAGAGAVGAAGAAGAAARGGAAARFGAFGAGLSAVPLTMVGSMPDQQTVVDNQGHTARDSQSFWHRLLGFADGGFHGPLPSAATIQPGAGRGLVQWAEGSTGGEAFIPLRGGDRSRQIWAQTGHLLGVFGTGGINGADGVDYSDNVDDPDMLGSYGPDVVAAAQKVGTAYSQALRNDCSGMVGQVVNEALGIAGNQLPTTQNMGQWLAERGFQPGVGGPGDTSVGWYNHGSSPNDGHAAMTLSNGMNFEQGGTSDSAKMGPGAAGAFSSEFDHHMYLPGGGYGSGGSDGYYTPATARQLREADEKVADKEQQIRILEERQSELKSTAKQSERDRIQAEIDKAKRELADAESDRDEVRKGTFHEGRSRGSRSGGGGTTQFGAPLPANFGLDKGLPGLAEWLVDFVGDLAVAPLEGLLKGVQGGMLGDADGTGPGGTKGLWGIAQSFAQGGNGSPGGFADLGDRGTQISSLAANFAPVGPDTGSVPGPAGAPGSAGTETNGAPTSTGAPVPAGGAAPAPKPPAAAAPPPPGSSPFAGRFSTPEPYQPAPPVYGPPSPDAGLGLDALSKLHDDGTGSWGGWGQGPGVAGPPGLPPSDIPHTPSGGIDYGALQKRFPGVPQGMTSAPPTSNYAKSWYQPYGKRFAVGGPSGNDTIPAWLSPGEMVMNPQATKENQWALQMMNAGHYDQGTPGPLEQKPGHPASAQPKPAPKPPTPGGAPPKPDQKPGTDALKPGATPGGKPDAAPPIGAGPELPINPDLSGPQTNMVTPGPTTGYTGTQAPLDVVGTPQQDTGTGSGLNVSGGLLGMAESLPATALSAGGGMFPGGGAAASAASAGIQIGIDEMNRAISYGGQVAGIALMGLGETFFPDAGNGGILGKVIGGAAGAHPISNSTADQAQQGQGGYQDKGKGRQQNSDAGELVTGGPPNRPQVTNTTTSTSGDTVHGDQIHQQNNYFGGARSHGTDLSVLRYRAGDTP